MRAALAVFGVLLPAVALGQALPQPQVLTQPVNDNSSRAASTGYVDRATQSLVIGVASNASAILAEQARAKAVEASLLPLTGGTLTGPVALASGSTGDASKMNVAPSQSGAAGSLARVLYAPAPALIGAKGDGSTDDTAAIQAAINDAIASGRRSYSLPSGASYALTAGATGSDGAATALKIASATDFTLDCQGSTLALKAPGTGASPGYGHVLRVENSARVTLDRCAFDYVNLPFTQSTLASVNTAAKTATFTLDPAFPVTWDRIQQIEAFDPISGTVQAIVLSWSGGTRAVTLAGNSMTVDFSASGDQAALSSLTVGGSYLITRQQYGANAISADNVDGLTIRRSPIYATAGMGLRVFNSRNVTVEDGSGSRLKTGRWRSTNADATHFADVRGRLIVRGNTIEGTGDDGLNVYPIGRTVAGVSGIGFTISQPTPATGAPTLTYSWLVGDTLSFAGADGTYLGTATVAALSASGGNLTVTASALPSNVAAGSYVWNSSAAPIVTVRSNVFSRIRGSAAIVQAERGEVAGNTISQTTSEAIALGGAYFSKFNEGGAPISLSATDNDIVDANNGPAAVSFAPAAITAYRSAPNGSFDAPTGLLGTVVIRNNRIRRTRGPCVYAASAASLDLGPNTCDGWAQNPDASAVYGQAAQAFVLRKVGSGRATLGAYLNTPAAGLRGFVSAADTTIRVDAGNVQYWPFVTSGSGYYTPDDATGVMLHASGTVASLNLVLPAKPVDQQRVAYTSDQTITTLNVYPASGQQVSGGPTTLAQFGRVDFMWSQQYATWYRVQ